MNEELKRVVEAVLFAAARKLELAEIAKLCKRPEQDVLEVLTQWKAELDASNSPTMLIQDGSSWKLTVREKYASVIKKVVTKTELPKGHMETLAVVAYKAPVLQSKVIKIRTNKAYDHLAQLENSGFITREKSGRTKLIKLTPKFFEYFDIDPSKLKHKFDSAGDVEKAIEAKEKEIEEIEESTKKQAHERLDNPQIALQPDKGPAKELETYPSVQPVDEMLPTGVQVFMEKLDGLEVYDLPHSHEKHHKKKPKKKHPHKVHHEEEPKEIPEEDEEKPAEELPKEAEKFTEEPAEEIPEEAEEEPVEVIPKEEKRKAEPTAEEKAPEEKIAEEAEEEAKKTKPKKSKKRKGLFSEGVPPEVETKIEKKIEEMLHGPPKEEREGEKEDENKQ